MYSTSQKANRLAWLTWPAIIIGSAIAAVGLNLSAAPEIVRAPIVFWFLLVCPGMAFVRLLRIDNLLILWTLAIALSLALSTLVPTFMLYIGAWSSFNTLLILAIASAIGALLEIFWLRPVANGEVTELLP